MSGQNKQSRSVDLDRLAGQEQQSYSIAPHMRIYHFSKSLPWATSPTRTKNLSPFSKIIIYSLLS